MAVFAFAAALFAASSAGGFAGVFSGDGGDVLGILDVLFGIFMGFVFIKFKKVHLPRFV